jgi:hypothetical protein
LKTLKRKDEKELNNMEKGGIYLALLMICLSITDLKAADIDSLKFYDVKNTIISEISKLDSCGLPYLLSMPTPDRDSLGNYTQLIQKVAIFNPDISSIIYKTSKDDMNKVLLELLDQNSDYKLAWSANIILYNINNKDGSSLIIYGKEGCLEWFAKQKHVYVAFWNKALDR